MHVSIDYSSDLPMYEQIKNSIKENILSGKLKSNDVLPSVRQLAKELNVSTITTKRTYIDLEHEGFIYTISGKGTFVKEVDISSLLIEKKEKLIEELKVKVSEMKETGLSKEEIIKVIEKTWEHND